jgi:hypothetical protein
MLRRFPQFPLKPERPLRSGPYNTNSIQNIIKMINKFLVFQILSAAFELGVL